MRSLLAVLIAAPIALSAQSAGASSIVYLEDLREIHVSESASTHGSGYSITVDPSPPFSYFAQSRSGGETFASQASAMNAAVMTASGEASVYLDIFTNTPLAYSTFHVRFEITEPTPFTLSGSLDREEWGGAAFSDGYVRLSSGGVDLYFLELPLGGITPLTLAVSASGVLAPGEYELVAHATAFHTGSAASLGLTRYDIAFSTVPEPATAALLLAGLAAARLAGLRLRGKTRSTS